jgi:hypothetical protein
MSHVCFVLPPTLVAQSSQVQSPHVCVCVCLFNKSVLPPATSNIVTPQLRQALAQVQSRCLANRSNYVAAGACKHTSANCFKGALRCTGLWSSFACPILHEHTLCGLNARSSGTCSIIFLSSMLMGPNWTSAGTTNLSATQLMSSELLRRPTTYTKIICGIQR